MGESLKNIPITAYIVGLVFVSAIAALMQEFGGKMSGVFVQSGLCQSSDSICALLSYIVIASALICVGAMLDLFRSVYRRKNIALEVETDQASENKLATIRIIAKNGKPITRLSVTLIKCDLWGNDIPIGEYSDFIVPNLTLLDQKSIVINVAASSNNKIQFFLKDADRARDEWLTFYKDGDIKLKAGLYKLIILVEATIDKIEVTSHYCGMLMHWFQPMPDTPDGHWQEPSSEIVAMVEWHQWEKIDGPKRK